MTKVPEFYETTCPNATVPRSVETDTMDTLSIRRGIFSVILTLKTQNIRLILFKAALGSRSINTLAATIMR